MAARPAGRKAGRVFSIHGTCFESRPGQKVEARMPRRLSTIGANFPVAIP
jgi:hypothetical protein